MEGRAWEWPIAHRMPWVLLCRDDDIRGDVEAGTMALQS